MRAPVLLTALSLALLTACNARTFTTVDERVTAGSLAELTVNMRGTVNPGPVETAFPKLCAAFDESWPAPTLGWARQGGTPAAATSEPELVAEANERRDVSLEGLVWHCFSVPEQSRGEVEVEVATLVLGVYVPETASGRYLVRTLGWTDEVTDEAQHVLLVDDAPADTFDRWTTGEWEGVNVEAFPVWSGDRFVAIRSGKLAWSSDGVTWVDVDLGEGSQPPMALAWGNGVWVGVLSGETPWLGVLSFAEETATWETTFATLKGPSDLTFVNGLFVAVGAEGLLLTSPDGREWTSHPSPGNDLQVAAGNEQGFLVIGQDVVLRSTDGAQWTATPTSHEWSVTQRPVYGNGRWLAAAQAPYTGDATLVESTDGWQTWQPVPSLLAVNTSNWPRVFFVDGRFVVIHDVHAHYGSGTSGWAPMPTGFSGYVGNLVQNAERVLLSGDWGLLATATRKAATAPAFVTRGFSPATIDEPYLAQVAVTGGQGVVTLSVVDGELPPGLALEQDVITGAATQPGIFTFTLGATDAAGVTASALFTLEVSDPLRLPDVEAFFVTPSEAAELRIAIRGGTPPYEALGEGVASVRVEGSEAVLVFELPEPDTQGFSLLVGDDAGTTVLREYQVVALAEPAILNVVPDTIIPGESWSTMFNLSNYAPSQWSVEGTLPARIRIEQDSGEGLVLAGIHTAETDADYPIVIKAIDPLGRTVERSVTLKVRVPPRAAVTALPGAIVGQPYSFELTAGYGQAPFTWLVEGELPEGLAWTAIAGGRKLSGTPQASGNYPQMVRVTDARGLFSQKELGFGVAVERATLTQATVTPGLLVTGQPFEAVFLAEGGATPYRFTVAGDVPPGVAPTWDGERFVIKGVMTKAGTYSFTVTHFDAMGLGTDYDEVTVQVVAPPRFVASTLPEAIVGVPYTRSIEIADGTQPFELSYDGDLPAGLTLEADDDAYRFVGTPTEAGEFSITVTVTDANELTATRTFELKSVVSPPPVVVAPQLPLAVVGQAYEVTYTLTGGQAPVTWTHSGTLPDGLAFEVSEVGYTLSGTPTTAGASTFKVKVTDTYGFAGESEEQSLEVVTTPAVVELTLAEGQVGVAYQATFEATGGTTPYVWTSTGDLPAGLTLAKQGDAFVLSGTPTAEGTFTFEVKVTDAHALEDGRSFTLKIAPAEVDEEPVDEEPVDEEPVDEQPVDEQPAAEDTGCGGCDATGATSLMALAGLALLRRRRG